jgi:cytochrome b6-f complex iron-sulfur subunit
MKLLNRRSFLGSCLGGSIGTLALSGLYVVFKFLAPRKEGSITRKVQFADGDIPAGGAKFFEYAGKSAVLIRRNDGTLAAFSAVCTHLGCVVQWQKEKEQFLCPCHAGVYSSDGAVLAGPPPKPLTKINLEMAGGTITVG